MRLGTADFAVTAQIIFCDPCGAKTYKMGGTPQTIVISPEGQVLKDWMGAYVGEQKDEIEAYFHVKLPGLVELPKQPGGTVRLREGIGP